MTQEPDVPLHGPLIDAAALHARLDDPRTLVVDVRHDLARPDAGRAAYESGHIPGAFFMHLDQDLSGPQRSSDGRFRGRHPLPDPEAFARRLAALGVEPSTQVVAYDEGDGMFAARLWWLAHWLGHAQVAVLDGGLRAWQEAGFELASELPRRRAASATSFPAHRMPVIDANALQRALRTPRYTIVDARAPERYRGDTEPLDAKAGHIPGALNRWYKHNLAANGRFKPPAELRQEFEALLVDHPRDVVHQCGSGVSACHNLLAMAVAGLPVGALYAGSWSEWSSQSDRPVATGAAPRG